MPAQSRCLAAPDGLRRARAASEKRQAPPSSTVGWRRREPLAADTARGADRGRACLRLPARPSFTRSVDSSYAQVGWTPSLWVDRGREWPQPKRAQASPEWRRGAQPDKKRRILTQLEIKTQKQKQHTDVSQGGQSSRLAGPPTPGAGQRDRGADVSLRVQRPATAEPHACHTALCRRLARLRDGACGIVVSAVPARPRSGRPAHACKAGGGTGGQRWRVGAEIFVAPPSTGGRGSLIR